MPVPKAKLPDFSGSVKKLLAQLPRAAANTARNFFLDSFTRQGFIDTSYKKWEPRKEGSWSMQDQNKKKKARALLIKTGTLRRSIRIVRADFRLVHIATGAEAPYAQAHNEGYSGPVQQTVDPHTRRAHTRKAHTRASKAIKQAEVKQAQVEAYTRTLNQNIPQRQFMGNSSLLNRRLQKHIEIAFYQAFNT